jgi:beta-glucosidase
MKREVIIISLLLMTFALRIYGQNSNITTPKLGKDKIEDVIKAMTQEDKVYLLVGLGYPPLSGPSIIAHGFAGRTWDINRLGITTSILSDGPAGLRIDAHPKGTDKTFFCTAFPTATGLSSTWNTELVEQVGKAMGNEVLEYGCDVLLAPALNIQRDPLCGRNFEYYSEDPLIAGKIAAAMVRGVQFNGVGASIKHFAANNEETYRGSENALISQRALREIYLHGFEIAVKEAKPWTVMSSYNRLNGFYTSENRDLLTTVLRDEWGFKGMVMSDWGGGSDVIAQMNAGNDLIMPGFEQRITLLNALKNKTIDEKVLDKNLTHFLNFILKTPRFNAYPFSGTPDLKAHDLVARDAATESMVLLKNSDNTLPFKKIKKVALFGKTSYHFIVGGTGSGEVNFEHSVSLKEGLANAGYSFAQSLESIYSRYIDSVITHADEAMIKKVADFMSDASVAKEKVVDFISEMPLSKKDIEQQVRNSDIALITIGRNSGEGRDRKETDFYLSDTEKNLISDVSKAYHAVGKKVVVILNIGGVVETESWRDNADAILLAWQPGQEGGNAVADILKGRISPSGKLPMTFPKVYDDVPSSKTFHPAMPICNPQNTFYNEGIYVGYRYYDTFKVPTSYEFGYGISYTQFLYSNIKISNNVFKDSISVSVEVKNIGKATGKEVVELYLSAPTNEIEKPVQELKAFAKTKLLQPGISEVISFKLDTRMLASFWSGINTWVADQGQYEVRIGSSSKDIRQTILFILPEQVKVEKLHNVLYQNMPINELSRRSREQ